MCCDATWSYKYTFSTVSFLNASGVVGHFYKVSYKYTLMFQANLNLITTGFFFNLNILRGQGGGLRGAAEFNLPNFWPSTSISTHHKISDQYKLQSCLWFEIFNLKIYMCNIFVHNSLAWFTLGQKLIRGTIGAAGRLDMQNCYQIQTGILIHPAHKY